MSDLDPVRVVALTASLVDQVEDECQRSGMDGYIAKPFSRQQLLAEIELTRGSSKK